MIASARLAKIFYAGLASIVAAICWFPVVLFSEMNVDLAIFVFAILFFGGAALAGGASALWLLKKFGGLD